MDHRVQELVKSSTERSEQSFMMIVSSMELGRFKMDPSRLSQMDSVRAMVDVEI